LKGSPLFIASIRDVSERKTFEEKLTRLNQELEQRVEERTHQLEETNKELEAFSYSVSHDLRAPLRHITGFCDALKTDCCDRLNEEGQNYLQRVCVATKRMEELIDRLLALSRLGKMVLNRQITDISALAHEVSDELSATDSERQVDWQIAGGLTAWADPAMARAVLENLLGNAWKYTSRADHGVITLEAVPSKAEPVFVVRDNGVGFDMKYADKLFSPFQRLHRQDEFEGTGVGLATVQRIIHRHGGRIWAESSPGQGASFYFSFGRD
jgi:light-regulated signal transduction histidine kinase (bacteriophytochrome)